MASPSQAPATSESGEKTHMAALETTFDGESSAIAAAPVTEPGTPPPGWGTDDRISFSKETGKYVQEDDDGSEMEYNSKLKAWMPVVCLADCMANNRYTTMS